MTVLSKRGHQPVVGRGTQRELERSGVFDQMRKLHFVLPICRDQWSLCQVRVRTYVVHCWFFFVAHLDLGVVGLLGENPYLVFALRSCRLQL